MSYWKDRIVPTAPGSYFKPAAPRLPAFKPPVSPVEGLAEALEAAGRQFDARVQQAAQQGRHDEFATGKGDTCRDIAKRLRRDGAFASEKQESFARKLIEWGKPREAKPAASTVLSRLFAAMQRLADIHAGELKLSRRNQDSLVWVLWADKPVGKLEGGTLTLWRSKLGDAHQTVLQRLQEFDANPLEAAQRWGRATGRCCVCGRELTDPESIAAGIGPTCAERFA